MSEARINAATFFLFTIISLYFCSTITDTAPTSSTCRPIIELHHRKSLPEYGIVVSVYTVNTPRAHRAHTLLGECKAFVGRAQARPATFARCADMHAHWRSWLIKRQRKRQGRLRLRVAQGRMRTGAVG